MNGKKQFKQTKNECLDIIMEEYSVDKDTAYKALSIALDDSHVLNAISKALANQFCKEEEESKTIVSPFESWAEQFIAKANKRY